MSETKSTIEALEPRVREAINGLISSSPAPHLFTVERVDQMAYALTRFVVQSTEKYINGQIEHGSNAVDGLETRDLHREREQEIQDLFWYETAETWKK